MSGDKVLGRTSEDERPRPTLAGIVDPSNYVSPLVIPRRRCCLVAVELCGAVAYKRLVECF